MALSRAWLRRHPGEPVELQAVCRQAPGSEDAPPLAAALSGFLRTLSLEAPQVRARSITLAAGVSAAVLYGEWGREERQVRDACLIAPAQQIRRTGQQRSVCRLVPRERPAAASPLWREGGVYLITGGLGGIGRLVAEHLLRRYGARVVLSGRSALAGERAQALEALRGLGGDVCYLQADVADRQEARRLIASVLARHGTLHGVLHAAGVVRDSFLLKKTPEELRQVLAPKVRGTLWLDKAVGDLPLDAFVLFASGSGVLGNAGQADYAYANAFLDAYARQRAARGAPGLSLSIDWPLWEQGGMDIPAADRQRLYDELGLVPMSTATALSVLELAPAMGAAQIMPLEGDARRMASALQLDGPAAPAAKAGDDTAPAVEPALVRSYLASALSEELKLPLERIEPREPFENFGINLVRIIGLTRRLERDLGRLPKICSLNIPTWTRWPPISSKGMEKPCAPCWRRKCRPLRHPPPSPVRSSRHPLPRRASQRFGQERGKKLRRASPSSA